MNVNKIRKVCRVVRIVIGLALIGYGLSTALSGDVNYWWFLGAVPLMAGVMNFCPLCFITKQCDMPETNTES